ncbi:MAG: hypothetical protein IPQ13_06290 [Holophagaceae bacterium]|nr:hypothetical protein [Holophagaceae bacterium]
MYCRLVLRAIVLAGIATIHLGMAQDLSKLPDWAKPHAQAVATSPAPSGDYDAWVILQRTEVAYAGSNEILTRKLRLVKVLTERGTSEGLFVIRGLGGKASKVKKLKGWNLRPDGELVRLASEKVVAIEGGESDSINTNVITGAVLERVVKGSWVAFESLEFERSPAGPFTAMGPMENLPVRRWELAISKNGGFFTSLEKVEAILDLVNFGGLVPQPEHLPGQAIALSNVPALSVNEGGTPYREGFIPEVRVRFLDPGLKGAPDWSNWNSPAIWIAGEYQSKAKRTGLATPPGKELLGLQALWAWMGRELTYKQVYLSPERGWVPEDASEVGRKRYGDCKDLSCFFIAELEARGYKASPVLARIKDGPALPEQPPFAVFNHLITAIPLQKSLGLPAEVDTPRGRFLLADSTDPFTPFGWLGEAHRGRSVLICLPDGGTWVSIPDAAIQKAIMAVDLKAELRQNGQLDGHLTFTETGQAWGLRTVGRAGGKPEIREFLLNRHLSLPPNGKLEIISYSDPLELDRPFKVEADLIHPKGGRYGGGDCEIYYDDLGLHLVPPQIQRPGEPRQLPVGSNRSGQLEFTAQIRVIGDMSPILEARVLDTPFRHCLWAADAMPEMGQTLISFKLKHEHRQINFPYLEREKGLQAWKKDRAAINRLLEDGFAFKAK